MADQTKPQAPYVPGALETAVMQAGNAALFGYVPEITEYLTGQEGAAQQIRDTMARGDAANPVSSWLGWGAGLALPGAALKKGYAVAKPVVMAAKPTVMSALGLAKNAGTGAVARGVAGKTGTAIGLSGLGGLAYGVLGSGGTASPDAVAPAAPAAETKPVTSAEPPKPDWYDEMSGVTGLSRDTLQNMVRQEGGIRLSTVQALNGMKGRAPTPQQAAMARLDNIFRGQMIQAREAGDVQRSRELEALYSQIMAGVATSDDMIGSEVARVLNGEE